MKDMKDLRRSFGSALLVLIALLLTFKCKAALGWSPDFIIPVLVASAFFVDVYSLALLTLLAVWVLDWQTGLPLELWIVAASPVLAAVGKRFLPLRPWVTLAVLIVLAEMTLYVAAVGDLFFSSTGFILSNVAFAALFGLALFNVLEWAYGRRE